MHLASKSASSGRHKIHVRFYLKSDRFGHFWASGRFECIRSDFGTCRAAETFWASKWFEGIYTSSDVFTTLYWFEGILKAPELWNHEKRHKNTWIWAFVTKSLCFLRFFNTFIKNVVISLDVCKKCSVTWLELLKNQMNSVVFLHFWNAIFENLDISLDVCKKRSVARGWLFKKHAKS